MGYYQAKQSLGLQHGRPRGAKDKKPRKTDGYFKGTPGVYAKPDVYGPAPTRASSNAGSVQSKVLNAIKKKTSADWKQAKDRMSSNANTVKNNVKKAVDDAKKAGNKWAEEQKKNVKTGVTNTKNTVNKTKDKLNPTGKLTDWSNEQNTKFHDNVNKTKQHMDKKRKKYDKITNNVKEVADIASGKSKKAPLEDWSNKADKEIKKRLKKMLKQMKQATKTSSKYGTRPGY